MFVHSSYRKKFELASADVSAVSWELTELQAVKTVRAGCRYCNSLTAVQLKSHLRTFIIAVTRECPRIKLGAAIALGHDDPA